MRRSKAGITGGSWYGSYEVIYYDNAENQVFRHHSTNKSRVIKWAKEAVKAGKVKWVKVLDGNTKVELFHVGNTDESLRVYIRNIMEDMRGVPEFVLREATRKFIDEIKQHIKKHVLMTSNSSAIEREAFEDLNDKMNELEKEVNQLMEESLWMWTQRR